MTKETLCDSCFLCCFLRGKKMWVALSAWRKWKGDVKIQNQAVLYMFQEIDLKEV